MSKGHPKGLYPLFFTEMWERLAFYLMLGILVLYATDTERGGLGLPTGLAMQIYGTYIAFVYFMPFLGGMIADRLLGYRRSVFLGGILMAVGLFLLGVRSVNTFYAGLTILCIGNGFFKPNISTMVGNLYEPGDPRRDAGFNIFYMGINIGASISALLAAPLRNLWDFNTAFIAAGVGLLVGVTILTLNWGKLARADRRPEPDPENVGFKTIALAILLPAAVFGVAGYYTAEKLLPSLKEVPGSVTFGFLVGMLPVLAYLVVLIRKAGPEEKPGLKALMPIYVAGAAFFMILHLSGGLMTIFTEEDTNREGEWVPAFLQEYYCQKAMPSYYRNAAPSLPRPPEESFVQVDAETEAMFGAKRIGERALARVLEAHPDLAARFPGDPSLDEEWNFLACKVFPDEVIKIEKEKDTHGNETLTVKTPETAKALRKVILVRKEKGSGKVFPVLLVTPDTFQAVFAKASDLRLEKGRFLGLVNTELIVGLLNPVFVVILTPLVVAFFAWLLRRRREVTTARKIFIGLMLTTFSLALMAWACHVGGDGEQKLSALWLVAYYLVITFGELCLSPMGLSLVTKLSPKRLGGLMMGGWFLATAIGSKLSGFISEYPPTTVMFLVLAGVTFVVALFILVLLPWLDRTIKKYAG